MESKTYKVKFDDGEIEEFKLVGQNEVDIFENKISPSSMMGMELMNSKIGDYRQYEVDGYISKFEVLDIV
jgi:transcription elongation GreA/GreB family factor